MSKKSWPPKGHACENKFAMDVSVILCAHNPRADYLSRALDGLRAQTLPKDHWEFLLIDNASMEPLASAWNLSWHSNGRHVLEAELGLARARLRGMREASANLLIFVDDDNVLDPDYLSEAIRIEREWPMLGTWGAGSISPEFELQPPKSVMQYLPLLSLRDQKTVLWSNVRPVDATPIGAGLCVRRSVATTYIQAYQHSANRITDPRGKSLVGYGDYEISAIACNMGFGMGIFPELELIHLISKEHVSEDYFISMLEASRTSNFIFMRLLEATQTSNFMLHYRWIGWLPPSPFFSPRRMLSVIKSLITQRGFARRVYLSDLRAGMKARQIIGEYGHQD
jgi:glycosyltransferase involved in cell wall biosynthesis